jgi:hypothetical protein
MRIHRLAFVLLSLAIAPACTLHASANVDVDEDVSFELDDFGTTCSGSGRSETPSGVTTWTKTADGERCRIDATWSGTLIDMAEVNRKASEQAGDVKLTIEGIHLAFDDAALRDMAGANITPPRVPSWEAHFVLAGQPIGDFSGTDVTALITTPLELDVPPEGITLANQALAASAPLQGSGTATLLVEMADVATVAAATGPAIEFHFAAHVTSQADKKVF